MTVIPAVFSDVHQYKESCLKQTSLCMRQISMEKLLDLKGTGSLNLLRLGRGPREHPVRH